MLAVSHTGTNNNKNDIALPLPGRIKAAPQPQPTATKRHKGFTMLDMLDCYDWQEAFNAASGPDPAKPGDSVGVQSFNVDDVASVVAYDEGVNDESNWLILGTLTDGRIFYLSAGCDYTGWDCQCWGRSWVAHTMSDMIAYGIPEEERKRLKL